MTQMKVNGYTNPAAGTTATDISFGFTVDGITVYNQTTGDIYAWNSSMPEGSFFTVAGIPPGFTATNGFTPLSESTVIGASVSGITNANPGVITVDDTSIFGFTVGDTIKVTGIADDLSGTNSLNDEYTIASLTATTITTETNTSVTGFSVYVSGGTVTRISDIDEVPVAIENFAIVGLTFGSDVVGANSDIVTYVAHGSNSVV